MSVRQNSQVIFTHVDLPTSKCVAKSQKLPSLAILHRAIVTHLAVGIAFRSLGIFGWYNIHKRWEK